MLQMLLFSKRFLVVVQTETTVLVRFGVIPQMFGGSAMDMDSIIFCMIWSHVSEVHRRYNFWSYFGFMEFIVYFLCTIWGHTSEIDFSSIFCTISCRTPDADLISRFHWRTISSHTPVVILPWKHVLQLPAMELFLWFRDSFFWFHLGMISCHTSDKSKFSSCFMPVSCVPPLHLRLSGPTSDIGEDLLIDLKPGF